MARKLAWKQLPIIFAATFLVLGLVCLAVAATTYLVANQFVARAEQTTGTVIELEKGSVARQARDRAALYPVVRFTTADSEAVEFRSNTGSYPPAYDVGDTVTVAYDPDDPSDARIVSFVDLYLLPVIFGGIGFASIAVGSILLVLHRRRQRRLAWLRQHGRPIEAEVTAVRVDASYRVNGRNPYVVDAAWQDPHSGAVHQLRSSRLWTDPRPGIDVGHRVPARIDPNRPSSHLLDLPDPA